jgi:hypothetical protein
MTMGFIKNAVVATAMATGVAAMIGQGGAFADIISDWATFTGTGTMSPGLPTTGCAFQTDITFAGTGVVVGDDGVTAPATVNFDGNSGTACETLNFGQGSGTFSGTFSGNVSYQRTATSLQFFGSGTIGGRTHTIISATCSEDFTSVNPATSHATRCDMSFSSTGD